MQKKKAEAQTPKQEHRHEQVHHEHQPSLGISDCLAPAARAPALYRPGGRSEAKAQQMIADDGQKTV